MIKNLFKQYPFASRIVLGILMFLIAIILTGVIEGLYPYKKYFPFTGMLLLLIVTWVLYKIDGENLRHLGLNTSYRNLVFFLVGFLIGALAILIATLLRHAYTGESLRFDELFEVKLLMLGVYYILPMVVVEELLYRGYLFKKVIEKSNVFIANTIFAILFMLVHVLDTKVLSSLGAIIVLTVTIPIGHLLFATALLKSKTLLFPIGLHLGNNWATRHLITETQNKSSIMYVDEPVNFETWISFITFLVIWNSFYLLLIYLIWKWPENQSQIKRG
jgi:membrane protease YdiL (CAAX protease family)